MDTLADAPHSALSGVARVLVHAGKLNAKAAEELVRASRDKRTSFVSSVIGAGSVSSADLAHTLSVALALPLLDLSAIDATKLPKNVIEAKLASQYQVVVLGKRGNRLFIGGADPTDQEAAERIKFATQLSPEWVIVEHDKLAKLLETSGASTNEAMESLSSGDFEFDVTDDVTAPQESAEATSDVEDAPVVRFLQKMLIDAINLRASDLHFEPYEYHYRVRFRVDGELREITQPPLAIKDKLSARIKVISRLDIAERRVPQDGRMKLKFGNKAIDFRVSTLPTLFGEKIVMRLLDKDKLPCSTSTKLGFEKIEKSTRQVLETAIARPWGMVLVTGPTGSGKTNTLYSSPQQRLNTAWRPTSCHGRGPGGVQPGRRQPGARCNEQDRAQLRRRAEARSCGRTPTSSSSARSATSRPPRSPSRRRSPATSCCRRCTPTTRRRP